MQFHDHLQTPLVTTCKAHTSSVSTTAAVLNRQRRRKRQAPHSDQQLSYLAKLVPLSPAPQHGGPSSEFTDFPDTQHGIKPLYVPIRSHHTVQQAQEAGIADGEHAAAAAAAGTAESPLAAPPQPEVQQQSPKAKRKAAQGPTQPPSTPVAVAVAAAVPAEPSRADAAAAGKPAWAAAVDRRIASLPGSVTSTTTRSARAMRWSRRHHPALSGCTSPADTPLGRQGDSSMRGAGSSTSSSSSSSSSSSRGWSPVPQSVSSLSSVEEYLEGGDLSAEGEQQLCLAYQRYLQLQQVRAEPYGAQALLQQAAQSQQDGVALQAADSLADLLQAPEHVQREGLLAQELLLELYEPLLISRARRVQGRNPNADFRELLSAARQGLLRAAARFDAGRVADGSSRGARLAALAERYIKNALRDVLTEYQTAAVHVPGYVRELSARLHRVKQQLQRKQQSDEPSLADIAAAAGVSIKQAEQAFQATSGALQAMSLQSVDSEKEDKGKAGSGVDLQQVDVSEPGDSYALGGVVGAGGLAAARSGLQEEQDAAAEHAAVEHLLQGFMQNLQPQDRHLLQLKLDGGNISQAARELGKTKQWGSRAVERVMERLREDVRNSDLVVALKH